MSAEVTKRVWLIGESNPYGSDPRYALYCEPRQSAGGRLCHRILEMSERDYLRSFERRNLCAGGWLTKEARHAAYVVGLDAQHAGDIVVLLGRRVFDAFNYWGFMPRPKSEVWRPMEVSGRFAMLPHPSGLARAWNEPGAFARAREVVLQAAPWLGDVIGKATQ